MDLEFDKIYRIPAIALNVSRSHPLIKRDTTWLLQFTIAHGIFTLAFVLFVYNIICHDLKANDFSQACKNGVLAVVYIVITFQYCLLLWHQKSLLDMIKHINKDYELSKNLDLEDREVIYKYVDRTNWMCKLWLMVVSLGCGLFIIKNIVLMLYYYMIDDFRLVPFYDLIYPSIIEKHKDNIYVFLMTYLLMLIFDCYSGSVYIGYVPFGPILMLHACGQLELVEKRIYNLFVGDCEEHVLRVKLRRIVIQLQHIYSFVERIKDIFEVAYELTLKSTTVMLPITCYEVIEALNNGEVSLEFISFIIGAIFISSLPCYYSDLLMEKGESVRLSMYMCGWETKYDHPSRTTLQLMLLHAQRPITIRTIFRSICLEALTDVFQQSYAIFSLINAVMN